MFAGRHPGTASRQVRAESLDPTLHACNVSGLLRLSNPNERAIVAVVTDVALLNMRLIDRVTSEKGATSEAERAALLGVDLATLWRWRNRRSDIRLSTLYRIADALGVDVCELLVKPKPPSPPPPGARARRRLPGVRR